MQPIYTINLTPASGAFAFNNIPQNYTDLKVVISSRFNDTGSAGGYILGTINGDTGTNYSYTSLYQSIIDYGTSVVSLRGSNETYHAWARLSTNTAAWAGAYSTIEIDYPNYALNMFKQIYGGVAAASNSSSTYSSAQYAQGWRGNTPITSLQYSGSAGYVNGSTATLYGIAK